jgi:hypothetical protein
MRRVPLLLVAIIALWALPALAQTPAPDGVPTRISGTVAKLDGNTLSVATRDGQTATVTLTADAAIFGLAKASLADIKPGDFVASGGVKGSDGKIHAVEVRIFPEPLRGAGEGQRPWDVKPDGVMTNATVGTVSQSPDGDIIHVTYKGGESEYSVSGDVPILLYVPGDRSLLKPGAALFVLALKKPDGTMTANRVTAEKDGVKPPF